MLTIIIRSVIIYLIVLFVFRIMGKRQLGQMQPFELVLTLIIADLATIPMAEVSVPVLHGVVPLLTLVVLHFILTWLTKSSTKISKFVSGKPVIIINPKGIDYQAMKKLNLSIDDLFAALRECGYFTVAQIQYAIMETNGKISVMPKADSAPVTNSDMKIKAEDSFLPIVLVNEGKIMKDNCALAGIDEKEITNIIKKQNCGSVKEILLLSIDKSGEGYIQPEGKEGKSFTTKRLVSK
ncbi:MAG: DUF421 domain-containing protein [Clostridia bacterium]|nr:DUF421 domain-containing protein [Clostridia bacterium]MBQ8792041.1 DUF421 domain-containing protein [Clostridia bacterium]